ncbi:MAG: ABC transporter ATP-binding protein [Thermoprotei archaeon]
MSTEPLLSIQGVSKYFKDRSTGVLFKAVDKVSLEVLPNETVGIVGESGSGKTTLGKMIAGLIRMDEGKIVFGSWASITKHSTLEKDQRRLVSMIFQDPYESLNPAKTVYDILAFPLRAQKQLSRSVERELVDKALEEVRLTPPSEYRYKYPNQLSGGQRQRVALARALMLEPKLLIADEPTSMLDASLKTGMLSLLAELKVKRGMSMLLITHDLSVAEAICDRMVVMYKGVVVETGEATAVIGNPKHPYTQLLISSVPRIDKKLHPAVPVKSAEGSDYGCRFYSRCPARMEKCRMVDPPMYAVDSDRKVRCLLYE